MSGSVEFDAGKAAAAAAKLDKLADRLDGLSRETGPAMTVPPAGEDEVSTRAAGTMAATAGSFTGAAADGVHELRKLAATLRAHSSGLTQMDTDNATDIAAAVR